MICPSICYYLSYLSLIPEQFTVKAHPALLEGTGEGEGEGGGGAKKGGTIIPVYIHIHIQNHKTNKNAYILNSMYRAHCKNKYQSRKNYKS